MRIATANRRRRRSEQRHAQKTAKMKALVDYAVQEVIRKVIDAGIESMIQAVFGIHRPPANAEDMTYDAVKAMASKLPASYGGLFYPHTVKMPIAPRDGKEMVLPKMMVARMDAAGLIPKPCQCYACTKAVVDAKPVEGVDLRMARMFLCDTCGNKRCPHAADHRNPCTHSNEPGSL